MGFARAQVSAVDLVRRAGKGDGTLFQLSPVIQATDSNQTLPVAAIAGGLYVRNGMSAARTDTTDTAANILAAFPGMDIGDTFTFMVSVGTAFAWNIAAGSDVTLVGKTQIPASGFAFVMVTKTSATTVSFQIL